MSRQQRRAAERAALKQARRGDAARQAQPEPAPSPLTEARLAANQANAQFSTGPRTEEGKATSSRNSFKHGLYSKELVTPGEDPAELDALRADLFAEHEPATETEALLVNEIADQYWRLRRSRGLEVSLLADGCVIAHMNAVHRMMTSAERGFHKALATLTKLQKERLDEAAPFSEPKTQANEAAPFSQPKTQANEAAPFSEPKTQGGFVPQKPAAPLTEVDEAAFLSEPKILGGLASCVPDPDSPSYHAFQQLLEEEKLLRALERRHGINA